MQQLQRYLQQSWVELSKVVWPSRKDSIRLTVAVIVFSIVLAIIIGIIDFAFTKILQKIILKG